MTNESNSRITFGQEVNYQDLPDKNPALIVDRPGYQEVTIGKTGLNIKITSTDSQNLPKVEQDFMPVDSDKPIYPSQQHAISRTKQYCQALLTYLDLWQHPNQIPGLLPIHTQPYLLGHTNDTMHKFRQKLLGAHYSASHEPEKSTAVPWRNQINVASLSQDSATLERLKKIAR